LERTQRAARIRPLGGGFITKFILEFVLNCTLQLHYNSSSPGIVTATVEVSLRGFIGKHEDDRDRCLGSPVSLGPSSLHVTDDLPHSLNSNLPKAGERYLLFIVPVVIILEPYKVIFAPTDSVQAGKLTPLRSQSYQTRWKLLTLWIIPNRYLVNPSSANSFHLVCLSHTVHKITSRGPFMCLNAIAMRPTTPCNIRTQETMPAPRIIE
jgi:hypothetical protein